jgi:hypothetical protein
MPAPFVLINNSLKTRYNSHTNIKVTARSDNDAVQTSNYKKSARICASLRADIAIPLGESRCNLP